MSVTKIKSESWLPNRLCWLCQNLTSSLRKGCPYPKTSTSVFVPSALDIPLTAATTSLFAPPTLDYSPEHLKMFGTGYQCSLCQLLLDNIPERNLEQIGPGRDYGLEVDLWMVEYQDIKGELICRGQINVTTSPLWYGISFRLEPGSK
jgi:hypothetical protein